MGQASSSAVKKLVSPITGYWSGSSGRSGGEQLCINKLGVAPFIYRRRGSLSIDEDGHFAHEFYEEVIDKRNRCIMKKRKRNIKPQGEVDLEFPRLNVDFPVVLCETTCFMR